MLRGLFIRRTFLLLDWCLLLLIVLGVLFSASRILVHFRPPADVEGSPDASEKPGGGLNAVKDISEYSRIMASGLFGIAGQTVQEQPAAPKPEDPVIKPTDIKVKLCGTSATTPRDLYASAIILDEVGNTVRTYSVGQQVVENVILDEIHPREVILLNKNTNQREVLRFEDSKDAVAGGAAAAPPGSKAAQQPQPPPAAAGNRVNLKKTELVQDLFMNYSDIATQVKPEPYRDPNTGNITGLTANNLESIPIAKKLGVQNGDVLQTVNNEVIDSEQKILELVQKYRNTNTFRIGILRNGKPMVITYKLE